MGIRSTLRHSGSFDDHLHSIVSSADIFTCWLCVLSLALIILGLKPLALISRLFPWCLQVH